MCGNERGDIAVPTAEQYGGATIIKLRQTQPAILRRDFDSECADLGEPGEILRRDLAGAIDLVRIDVFSQIRFELLQERIASSAILGGLSGKWINPAEIIATDEKIAGETATVVERIARCLRQLERFALAFRHL